MSAIITSSGHVLAAQQFSKKAPYYFKLGKDATWTANPQAPNENSDVATLVGLKRVERVAFVVPDAAGSIQYRGKTYSEVAESNIFTRKANYVMLTADIQDGDFPLGTEYNQLVLCTNVVTKPGKANSYTLTPNDITSQGNTVIADYRRSVIMDESSIVHLTLILEF